MSEEQRGAHPLPASGDSESLPRDDSRNTYGGKGMGQGNPKATGKDEEIMSYEEIWAKATEDAGKAYRQSKPRPMAWQSSEIDKGFDWSQPYDIEPEGVCGFAWIWIPKARGKFVNWLKAEGKGSKNYRVGYDIWYSELVSSNSQSMERREAAMEAAVKVLRENGIDCYAESRMD